MGIEALLIATFVLSAATTAYQVIQAKKMKQKALEAADARKGFEVVIEGDTGYPPIVYGRALIGGMRVWHSTSSKYTAASTNADKAVLTGYAGSQAYTYAYSTFGAAVAGQNYYTTVPATGEVLASPTGYLSTSMNGTRNEFMFFQQVLCAGPISRVIESIIDNRYIDDPSLGSYGKIEKTPSEKEHKGVKAALRLDYHYAGSEADAVISANFGERSSSSFNRLTYLSAVLRLDRDNPQFSGVPAVQSIIEGRLVRSVTAGVISSVVDYYTNPAGYAYSTNPSLCLLDYLLDTVWGRGLALTEVDLPSFEAAATICAQIVQTDVHVGGKTWRPTDGLSNVTRRDIPLYECNTIIDPAKPFRENVEALLATMGDARLVWSQGKYHLNMQYPASNAAIDLSGEITDVELVDGEPFSLDWPNAETKYNHVIVKFHNEFENFVEDSVAWPPKYSGTYVIGIGAERKASGLGSWDDGEVGGRLLNAYSVWEGTTDTTSLTYRFKVDPDDAGTYSLAFTGDDTCTIALTDVTGGGSTAVYSGTRSEWKGVTTASVSLGSGGSTKIYQLVISGTNTSAGKDTDYKGVGASISSAGRVLWTTRSTSYDDFVEKTVTDAVYVAMLAEDNGLKLETSIFAEGITDPYHALAKAEELCRTSRSALKGTFKYIVEDKFYEPGDFLQITSDTLGLGLLSNLYARVEGAKVIREDRCEVDFTRFDYTQLAWNVKDDVYIGAPPVVGYFLQQPYEIIYSAPDATCNLESSGILDCTPVSNPEVVGYIWYVHRAGIDAVDDLGKPIFSELARTEEPHFVLGRIEAASAFFGVRSYASNGKVSLMTTTDPLVAVDLTHSWVKQVVLRSSSDVFQVDDEPILFEAIVWSIPNKTYQWFVDDTRQFGWSSDYFYLDKFTDTNQKSVRVAVLDLDTEKTYEDVIDVGYIAPGDTAGELEIYYLRQYEPPNAPDTYPPPSAWVTALPSFENVTRWQTQIRVSGGEPASPWTTPVKLDNWIFRGDFSLTTEYFIDHVVVYSGKSYISTVDYLTGETPSGTDQDTAYWQFVSGGGALGAPDPGAPALTLNITIPASTTTVNLRTLADAAGFDNAVPYIINYTVGGNIYGNGGAAGGGAGKHGIDTGSWPADAILTLNLIVPTGRIVSGGGGGGGNAGLIPTSGGNGGDAIYCRVALNVSNAGTIQGGGGGGRGAQGDGVTEDSYHVRGAGGAGGGGVPYGKGGASFKVDSRATWNGYTITAPGPASQGGNATVTVAGARGLPTGTTVSDFTATGGFGAIGKIPGAAYVSDSPSRYLAFTGTYPGVDQVVDWASKTPPWVAPNDSAVSGYSGYAVRKNGNTVPVTGAGTALGTVG